VYGPHGTGTFALVVVLLFVSGLGASWSIPLNVSFVQAVPSAFRGRAFGVAVSGLYGAQGIGMLVAGLLAEGLAPTEVVAVFGGLGLLAVVPCLVAYRRTQGHRSQDHMAGDAPAAGPSTS
jgi:MFS family permease